MNDKHTEKRPISAIILKEDYEFLILQAAKMSKQNKERTTITDALMKVIRDHPDYKNK